MLFSFIVNTCTIVENLQKEHIEAVTHLYKHLNDKEMHLCASEIQDAFYRPIDILTQPHIHEIWIKLLQTYTLFCKIGRFETNSDQIK